MRTVAVHFLRAGRVLESFAHAIAMGTTTRRMSRALAERGQVTVDGAADYLGVHPATVKRWIAAGLLEARRVGPRRWRINRESMERLLGGES